MKTVSELRDVKLRETLEAVKAEVARIAGDGARLILYGSHARGEGREDSDVDLMVVLPDALKTFKTEDRLREAIYDIGFDNGFVISVLLASESHVRDMRGFMVYGSVEKEGLLV